MTLYRREPSRKAIPPDGTVVMPGSGTWLVPVEEPVYHAKHHHDGPKPCQVCYLIDAGVLVEIGGDDG